MTPNERIIIEAQDATNAKEKQLKESPIRDYDRMVSELYGYNKGYIAGATTEHERNEDEIDKALHAERNKMQAKFNESDKQWAALLMEQNDRAQVLVDALDQFITYHETGLLPARHVYEQAVAARQQWKSGKGKEVEKLEAGFDYKSRHWEESKMRPASEEAIATMKERWKAEGKTECPDCGLWYKSEGRCPDCNSR